MSVNDQVGLITGEDTSTHFIGTDTTKEGKEFSALAFWERYGGSWIVVASKYLNGIMLSAAKIKKDIQTTGYKYVPVGPKAMWKVEKGDAKTTELTMTFPRLMYCVRMTFLLRGEVPVTNPLADAIGVKKDYPKVYTLIGTGAHFCFGTFPLHTIVAEIVQYMTCMSQDVKKTMLTPLTRQRFMGKDVIKIAAIHLQTIGQMLYPFRHCKYMGGAGRRTGDINGIADALISNLNNVSKPSMVSPIAMRTFDVNALLDGEEMQIRDMYEAEILRRNESKTLVNDPHLYMAEIYFDKHFQPEYITQDINLGEVMSDKQRMTDMYYKPTVEYLNRDDKDNLIQTRFDIVSGSYLDILYAHQNKEDLEAKKEDLSDKDLEPIVVKPKKRLVLTKPKEKRRTEEEKKSLEERGKLEEKMALDERTKLLEEKAKSEERAKIVQEEELRQRSKLLEEMLKTGKDAKELEQEFINKEKAKLEAAKAAQEVLALHKSSAPVTASNKFYEYADEILKWDRMPEGWDAEIKKTCKAYQESTLGPKETAKMVEVLEFVDKGEEAIDFLGKAVQAKVKGDGEMLTALQEAKSGITKYITMFYKLDWTEDNTRDIDEIVRTVVNAYPTYISGYIDAYDLAPSDEESVEEDEE